MTVITHGGRSQGERLRSVQARARGLLNRAVSVPELGYVFRPTREYDVAPWGAWGRDPQLRTLWRLAGAEPVQAATAAIAQKVQSTGWYLEGSREVALRVHSMLHNADFGAGWEEFLSKIIRDYLTQDNGMFIEILGEGAKDTVLTSAALGIAHLDAARCVRTGDPDFPVTYTDTQGTQHKIHWSRVWFQSDLPSPAETDYGVGFCALSRCVASTQALILWSTMRNEMLDDFPGAGVMAVTGVNKKAWDEQMAMYQADRARKEQQVYRGLITLFNVNPTLPMKIDLVNFRQLWENFQERGLYDTIIDLVAMAFGIDRQEIAPLATSALGSGAQSTVLNQKSRGKGVGNLLSLIERFVNRVIPEAVRFAFDFADDEQDMKQAEIRHMKASTILSIYTSNGKPSNIALDTMQGAEPTVTENAAEGSLLSRAEARYLLAQAGVIPRELLQDEERRINPEWEKFDEITRKRLGRFGERVKIDRKGDLIAEPKNWLDLRREDAKGVVWRVS